MDKVKWGIISTANIGMGKVNPAMRAGTHCDLIAIASRDLGKAREAADQLGIEKAYGSYEALFADPDVEAVYNPLPNHLHVPITKLAAAAGKHVLCEKPIALTAAEARELIAARDANSVLISEAFMTRCHPQWLAARDLVREGRIGDLRAISCLFSYYNVDGSNVRNMADIGGGALYDIGCYAITMSRFMFEAEPRRVVATIDRDPTFGTDRLTTAIMEFDAGHANFIISTQMVPHQRMQILGTKGRIEIEIPFNAPPDAATRILVDDGSDLGGSGIQTLTYDAVDQYTIQGDLFSKAVRGSGELVVPLENSIANMAVIDAVFRSAAQGEWATPEA